MGASLVIQWLRFWAPNAGGLSSILGQGTRSHMLQLKILHATTKTWHSQINELINKHCFKKAVYEWYFETIWFSYSQWHRNNGFSIHAFVLLIWYTL